MNPRTLTSLILLLALATVAGAAETKHPGQSFIFLGNSHSNPFRLLDTLAKATGHPQHRQVEAYILGTPLRYHWEHPEAATSKWREKLAQPWDAQLLLAWDSKDPEYAVKFAGEAYKANPKCQVLIYTIWPDANMGYEEGFSPIRSEKHTEAVADAVAKAFPNSPPPKVIPSSLLIRELCRLADRGELPGFTSYHAIYADGGHLAELGQYAINVMVCAILYNESPLDYPDAIEKRSAQGTIQTGAYVTVQPDPQAARVVKQLVADILATYPRAGMTPRLAIADRRLPAALAGQAYRHQLQVVHGTGPVQWSVAQGALPTGIALDPTGLLAGQPATPGRSELMLRAAVGNGTAERRLTLEVVPDKPLKIISPEAKPVALDEYLLQAFKADGAVGRAQWTVAAGKLPYGLLLNQQGMLNGTPGEGGEFAFTVRVQDQHPQGARTAELPVTLKVGPASAKTLSVRSVPAGAVKTDSGILAEPFWKLDQPIAQPAGGKPSSKATLALVWEKAAKPSKDGGAAALWLAVRVQDGPAGKSAKDGVHIYIDRMHNREVIYNADDLHFFAPRNQEAGKWVKLVFGPNNWFSAGWAREIAGGYEVLVRLSSNYLRGQGQWLAFGPKSVYGFDVVVDDATGRQAWRGNEKNDTDTSVFGSILIVNEPAAQ